MNSLQNITFHSHSNIIEFFKDLKIPEKLAVDFYAELETFISAYISRLVFAAHSDKELRDFKLYIDKKNITDEVKIANMLTISFERKTGMKVDQMIDNLLENFAANIDKAAEIVKKHSSDTDIENNIDEIYNEMMN